MVATFGMSIFHGYLYVNPLRYTNSILFETIEITWHSAIKDQPCEIIYQCIDRRIACS